MRIIRIGNDISVVWNIYSRNGLPFPLDGFVTRLWLLSGPYRREITDYKTVGHTVSFNIDADDITRYGIYKLVLSILDSESVSVDASFDVTEVFQIVSKSYRQDEQDILDGEVSIESSSILNNIAVATSKSIGLTLALAESGSTYVHNLAKLPAVSVMEEAEEVKDGVAGKVYRNIVVSVTHIDRYSLRIDYSPSPKDGIVYLI